MTFRLILLICTMLGGEPECHKEPQPGVYWSLKECAAAGQKRAQQHGIAAWSCALTTGETRI